MANEPADVGHRSVTNVQIFQYSSGFGMCWDYTADPPVSWRIASHRMKFDTAFCYSVHVMDSGKFTGWECAHLQLSRSRL